MRCMPFLHLFYCANQENTTLREEDRKQWWEVFAELQKLLRDGAKMASQLGVLTDKQAEKYFISGVHPP